MKKGIDISSWQGNLTEQNFKELSHQVDFIMIRCGYTGYGKAKNKVKDRYFEQNYAFCKQLNIPVGTYYYSCATTIEEAIEEANFILSLTQDKQFSYPIAIDTEDHHDITDPMNAPVSQYSIGKESLTEIIQKICSIVEASQKYVSIYASSSWFQEQLQLSKLTSYDKWVAQWDSSLSVDFPYGMWQYNANGTVASLEGIDLDYAYKNFPAIMKEFGLNNYSKAVEDNQDSSKEEINNNQDNQKEMNNHPEETPKDEQNDSPTSNSKEQNQTDSTPEDNTDKFNLDDLTPQEVNSIYDILKIVWKWLKKIWKFIKKIWK